MRRVISLGEDLPSWVVAHTPARIMAEAALKKLELRVPEVDSHSERKNHSHSPNTYTLTLTPLDMDPRCLTSLFTVLVNVRGSFDSSATPLTFPSSCEWLTLSIWIFVCRDCLATSSSRWLFQPSCQRLVEGHLVAESSHQSSSLTWLTPLSQLLAALVGAGDPEAWHARGWLSQAQFESQVSAYLFHPHALKDPSIHSHPLIHSLCDFCNNS